MVDEAGGLRVRLKETEADRDAHRAALFQMARDWKAGLKACGIASAVTLARRYALSFQGGTWETTGGPVRPWLSPEVAADDG